MLFIIFLLSLTFALYGVLRGMSPKEAKKANSTIDSPIKTGFTRAKVKLWEEQYDPEIEFSLFPKNTIAAHLLRFPISNNSSKFSQKKESQNKF